MTKPVPDAAAGRCRRTTRSPIWRPRALCCSTTSAFGKTTSSVTRWVARSGCNRGRTGPRRGAGREGVYRLVLVNPWGKTHPHTLRCFAARKSLLLNTGVAAYVLAQPLFLYPAMWLAGWADRRFGQGAGAGGQL